MPMAIPNSEHHRTNASVVLYGNPSALLFALLRYIDTAMMILFIPFCKRLGTVASSWGTFGTDGKHYGMELFL